MQNLIIFILIYVSFSFCTDVNTKDKNSQLAEFDSQNYELATLAGGCFWCIEAPFESIHGVVQVVSGYSGGSVSNPTYEMVSDGKSGYKEAVQVFFDPSLISYSEILDVFWKQFDPTDSLGSFYDRGQQYQSSIFYHNETQKNIANDSKLKLQNSGVFKKPIATEIIQFSSFYTAEDYHQDYYKKNPNHYYNYKKGSGRDAFIKSMWGDENTGIYFKNANDEMNKKKLSELQFNVTQNNSTEKPFDNLYWNNIQQGLYVDIVSGEPLFSSKDKFHSESGWPSFSKAIDVRFIKKLSDSSYGVERIEVRSKIADSHLGHIFNDGPEPTNLRYCINSASLKFIPKDKMNDLGYSDYLWLVE